MTQQQIGARIKDRRKELDMTLQDVADRVGVARSTIQRYEAGTISQMKMPVLYSIAQAIRVNPDWLVGKSETVTTPGPDDLLRTVGGWATTQYFIDKAGISAREYSLVRSYRIASPSDRQIIDNIVARYPTDDDQRIDPEKTVPLFGTAAAAGPGEFDTGLPFEEYAVPASSRADFAVRVSGDSMEPVLHDGQIALCVEKAPQIGDVAVMMVNGALVVKQFIRDNYGNLYLRSLNRARKDLDLDIMASGNDTVTCYGTVILSKRPPLVIE